MLPSCLSPWLSFLLSAFLQAPLGGLGKLSFTVRFPEALRECALYLFSSMHAHLLLFGKGDVGLGLPTCGFHCNGCAALNNIISRQPSPSYQTSHISPWHVEYLDTFSLPDSGRIMV